MKRYFRTPVYLAFITPALILFTVFTIVPVIVMIPMALQDTNGVVVKAWVGLDNLKAVFADPKFIMCMKNVLKIFLINFIALVYSWVMAFRLSHIDGWLNKAARFAYMFPFVLAVTTVGKYGQCLFGYNGLVNDFIQLLGFERVSFMSTVKWAMWTCAIISAWWGFGSGVVGRYAAIKTIPQDLVEAAALDGASESQIDIYILFPLMNHHHTLTIINTISSALMTYALTQVMASGLQGVEFFNTPISFIVGLVSKMKYGPAAAYSLVYFVFCVGVSLLVQKLVDLETYEY